MANNILKPPKEIKELPNNCKLLVQQILQGVSFELAYRVNFGAAAENLSERACTSRAKAIFEHPTMQKYADSLVKREEPATIKKAAETIEQFLNEANELKALALTKTNAKGQVMPDLKNALAALKMIGDAKGYFNHAQEVNINIRDMLQDTDKLKEIDAVVVDEIDELKSLPFSDVFVNGEKKDDV